MDKQCEPSVNPTADKPECYGTVTGTDVMLTLVDVVLFNDPGLYCGS
jgi:hypothetical protein